MIVSIIHKPTHTHTDAQRKQLHRTPKVQSMWHHVGRNGCVSKASMESVSKHLFILPPPPQNHCDEFTALKI